MTGRQHKPRPPRSGQGRRRGERDGDDAAAGEPGVLVAHHGVAVEVRLDQGGRRKVKVRRRSGHVVGDEVEVFGERLIRGERHSQLRRSDAMGRTHVVAANLDVLGLVVAPVPASPSGFIDRALVCARAEGITPFMVVNKADLAEAEALVAQVRATWIDGAGGIELPLFMVSAAHAQQAAADGQEHESLDPLLAFLATPAADGGPRRAAFVGTSGVGKSSLVNAILPAVDLTVGDINRFSGLGRHTTTTATLHALPRGGELIDTPGFRDFGLVEIDAAQLSAFFPGFAELMAARGCRFNDCRHDAEPDCAIKAAVADGRLERGRWDRYRELLHGLSAS